MNGRAELKVDGGKLLRADVAVGDSIEAVELHGDFFVYPPAALDDIERAVEGTAPDSDADAVSERIAAAVGPDVRMVGFGPDHVAQVVAEAVDDAR